MGERLFTGGGELGALMQTVDWAATPLGPVEGWPQSLRTTLDICLRSAFPMLLWWGPDAIQLYNDGYRPVLGDKHPRSLGQSGPECWREIWPVIGPLYDEVLRTQRSTWSEDLLLLMNRAGFEEETYFTFSYSPVRDESGGIAGVLVTCVETTGRVIGERRVATLKELAARCADVHTPAGVAAAAAEVLAGAENDLPFSLIYLLDEHSESATLAASCGTEAQFAPTLVPLADGAWPLGEAAAGRAPLATAIPGADGGRALVVPLLEPARETPSGFLVAGLSARLAHGREYEGYVALVASHIAGGLNNARLHDQTRRRAEELAALDHAKTVFFTNVSHEFRTPLTLLLAPIGDLLDGQLGEVAPTQRTHLEMARRNALRLLKLVNTLLDFARIEAGRSDSVFEPVDLCRTTEDIASAFRSAFERAGLAFTIVCDPFEAPVYVDRDQYEKIVLNLLSNALKYTLDGSVEVRVGREGDQAVLTVKDTGVGIAREDLPHLFERFRRMRQPRARSIEGTGIGLALVHELVRQHGGSIAAESREGTGTTFRLALPLGFAHLPPERVFAARSLPSTALGAEPFVEEALRWLATADESPAQPSQPLAREQARVLVVDDNADMRTYVANLLRTTWAVETAADGDQALARIHADPPTLVLADVMMPGLDGFELLRCLREDPATRELPVVLISARAGEEARLEGLRAGANDYIVKPFTARALMGRVGNQLRIAAEHRARVETERRTVAQLEEIARLNVLLHRNGSLDDILAQAAASAARLVSARMAAVSLGADRGRAEPTTTRYLAPGFEPLAPLDQPVRAEAIDRLVREAKRPVRLTREEMLRHPAFRTPEGGVDLPVPPDGWLAVPLNGLDGRTLGVLQVAARESGDFTDEDEAILVQLAQTVAVAIETGRLIGELERSNGAKDELLGLVSHELRTPLTMLRGNANMLARQEARLSPGERTNALRDIERNAERLTETIENMLVLSRTGPGELEMEPILLERAVREAMREHLRRHPGADVTLHVLDVIPPVLGQEPYVTQVVLNLLGNAAKYAPGAPVAITLSAGDGRAEVEICDEGPGIASDELAQLFTPFFRGAAHAAYVSGSGLGLTVCQRLVEAVGGEITVDSVPGHGAAFRFTVPYDHAAIAAGE